MLEKSGATHENTAGAISWDQAKAETETETETEPEAE